MQRSEIGRVGPARKRRILPLSQPHLGALDAAPLPQISDCCLATGAFSGLTGVGGGAMLVSLMVSLLEMKQRLAQGTSLAIIMPVAFFGALTYAIQGLNGQFPFNGA